MFRLREAYHENRNLLVQMQGTDQASGRPIGPAPWQGSAGVELEPRVDREIRLYIGIVGTCRLQTIVCIDNGVKGSAHARVLG